MKKVWRVKKISSVDDGTKDSTENQHPTKSKMKEDNHVIVDEHSVDEENPSIDSVNINS